jgi:hypothetical protein
VAHQWDDEVGQYIYEIGLVNLLDDLIGQFTEHVQVYLLLYIGTYLTPQHTNQARSDQLWRLLIHPHNLDNLLPTLLLLMHKLHRVIEPRLQILDGEHCPVHDNGDDFFLVLIEEVLAGFVFVEVWEGEKGGAVELLAPAAGDWRQKLQDEALQERYGVFG